jgi:hypothetical protein
MSSETGSLVGVRVEGIAREEIMHLGGAALAAPTVTSTSRSRINDMSALTHRLARVARHRVLAIGT